MERLPLQSGALTGEQIERLLEPAMAPEDLGRWKGGATRSVNFAYAAPEIGRFRVNLASTLTGPAAVVRRIPHEVPTTEALGLPPAGCALAELPAGLVFVTGASGEGKSSTLAALLDRINRTRGGHALRRACASISCEASTATISASGAASSSAAVDAPVPQPMSRIRPLGWTVSAIRCAKARRVGLFAKAASYVAPRPLKRVGASIAIDDFDYLVLAIE